MKAICIIAILIFGCLLPAPAYAARGHDLPSRMYVSILADPACRSMSHLSVMIAPGPYTRQNRAVKLRRAVTREAVDVNFEVSAGHHYVQIQTSNCGLRWAADVLPGHDRHFIAKLAHIENAMLTDLIDSDAVLCGTLPGIGVKAVDLITHGQNERPNVMASAMIDGSAYYFENAPALSGTFLRVELIGGYSVEIPVSVRWNERLILNITAAELSEPSSRKR